MISIERKQRKIILITICLSLMAVIASVSGLNVAQSKLAVDFNTSQNTVLWMINIYTLALAALLLPLGALGDRKGRKPALLAGLTIFIVASVISGLAVSVEMMILARFLSGVGAALIMPVTLAVITSGFPVEERSNAIGIWTGVAGGGGILGMYLSALLVDFASWRLLFLLPVVLGVVSIILTSFYLPNSKEKYNHRYDITGALLSVISIFSFIYALHEVPSKGWSEPLLLIMLFVGFTSLVGFVFWEMRHPLPLLDIRLFRKQSLSSGSITLLTLFGVQAGIFIVLFPYFQGVLGWSGLRATLAMMPMALLMMTASGIAPRISLKIGTRFTMAVGIALGSFGAGLMAALVSVEGGYLSILPGLLVIGFGMGLTMTPSTEAITSSLPLERQGVASALNDITRELGTAIGVALLGSVVTAGYSAAIEPQLYVFPVDIANSASEGLYTALTVAANAGPKSQTLIEAARSAFVYGWQQSMWIGSVIMAFLFFYVMVRGPKKGDMKTEHDTLHIKIK
nr:MFS transporter [Flavobacterium sp. HTF]